MYESHKLEPLPTSAFASRLAMHIVMAAALVAVSLALGMAGYMELEHMSVLDAFLNAAMLLGGMGPISMPATDAGKFFAGSYALYAGLVFLMTAALIFTPIIHRVLHKFHWDAELD